MIWKISTLLNRFGLRIPEVFWKGEIVRFITESRSERIVEIPLVLSNIPHKKSRILDIGCRYSLLPIQLASLGHEIYGIDIYNYGRKHPNLHFFRNDFLESPFRGNFFDVVISLSTIEHIGLGFYGEKRDLHGDKRAVEEVKRVLKPKGIFLLTAPFGRPTDSTWYRVYDKKRITSLLSDFEITTMKVFSEERGIWQPVSIDKAEEIDSACQVRVVIFILAQKK